MFKNRSGLIPAYMHARSVKRSNSERRKVYYMKDLVVLKFGMNVLEVPFQ